MQPLDAELTSQVLATPRLNHPRSLGRSLWGRAATWLMCHATAKGAAALVAAGAGFSEPAADAHEYVGPTPSIPVAPPPLECLTFSVSPTFVPFARRTEIRPVGDVRPFIGAHRTTRPWAPDGAHLGSGEQLRVATREMRS
jgi:hypothetical protein